MASVPANKEILFGSISFSLSGIKSLMADLTEIVQEQGEIEISQTKRREDQTEEEFKDFIEMARKDVFKILATVNFTDRSSLHTSDPNDIQIEDLGPFISSIYVSNQTPYKRNIGVEPHHMFELFLDFAQPALADPGLPVSLPTPNNTHLTIRGTRAGWRTAIEDAVKKRIKKRRIIRSYFHRAYVYDLGLMIVGIPLAIYACWYFAPFIQRNLGNTNPVVYSGAYIYVALSALWVYRILFSYTKWAFPLVELTDQSTRPTRHRKVWWGLIALITGKLFWPLVDPYISLPVWWNALTP